MNTFAAALAGSCAAHRFEEKRLVAPSRRVGNQWLEAAARAGHPALNVRVETLRSLAVELAFPQLARDGLAVAPRRAEALLVERLLRELLPRRLPYLRDAAAGPGLAGSVLAALTALRLQDLPPARLRAGALEWWAGPPTAPWSWSRPASWSLRTWWSPTWIPSRPPSLWSSGRCRRR